MLDLLGTYCYLREANEWWMRDLYHRNRNTGFQTGWSSALNWKIDMLNHLLILMDSIQLGDGIVIFFTTNFPKKLDGAFTRSGRLDLILTVTHPEKEERMQLFKLFLKNKTYDKKILPPLMPLSTGMTGADRQRNLMDYQNQMFIIHEEGFPLFTYCTR